MEYISVQNYKCLNSKTNKITHFLPIAKEIETLAKGGYGLDPVDYLLIRDEEDVKITQKRIEKFSPKNYLGSAIRLQRTKQNSGEFEVDIKSLPGDSDRWNAFLSNVDKKGSSFKDFVISLFESCLINKVAYVQVELPKIDLPDNLNSAQLENVLSTLISTPYLLNIPLQTIMGEEEKDTGFVWVKYKLVTAKEDPLFGTKYDLSIVIVDDIYITKWTFSDVKLSPDNDPVQIYDQNYNNGKGGYRRFEPEKEFAEPISVEHRRGVCPVLKFELPDSLWMTNQVYQAQKVIYGLHMNLLHTAANSGFVQKWGKPYVIGSASSPGGGPSMAPVSKEIIAEIVSKYAASMGDESILMMESFNFEEMLGTSVEMQAKIIDDLKTYIFQMIAMNAATLEEQPVQQSGRAKEIDLHLQNVALKNHGSEIINFSRKLLKNVARAFGFKSDQQLENISVSGMSRFDTQVVSETLDTVERLFKLPKNSIPKVLYQEALSQLANVLLENHNYSDKAELNNAIAQSLDKFLQTPDSLGGL